MDRAEAIKILEIQLDVTSVNTPSCIKLHEAIELAIEALQEPTRDELGDCTLCRYVGSTICDDCINGSRWVRGDAESTTTTEDCISRQAAIDALQNPDGCTDLGTDDLFLSMGMAVKKLLLLPSVEPPKKVIAQIKVDTDEIVERIKEEYEIKDRPVCEDCISRQQAIEAIEGVDWYHVNSKLELVHGSTSDEESWYRAEDIYKAIESLPPVTPKEQTDCTDLINWLLEEVLDEENWELNAVANGEIICRKLKKLGLLEVKDGYYVRASVTPTERTGEWVHEVDTGTAMLKCSECECRVVEKWYRLAVGTKANKCPYCGADMRPKDGEEE